MTNQMETLRATGGSVIKGEQVSCPTVKSSKDPMFALTFPEENLFGVAPGVANSVSDSYSIIIAPPPGEYVITVTTGFENPAETFVGTVRVIVEAPQGD
jgi:hypothetical protein